MTLSIEDRVITPFQLFSNKKARLLFLELYAHIQQKGRASYISGSITSGQAMYQACLETGATSIDELRKNFYDVFRKIEEDNLGKFKEFKEKNQDKHLIDPSKYNDQKGWDGIDYMTMWMPLLITGVKEIHTLEGWNFSNGATREVATKILMQEGELFQTWQETRFVLPYERGEIYDPNGKPLSREDVLNKIEESMEWLQQNNFPTNYLERAYQDINF
jgi:hypothetical protein